MAIKGSDGGFGSGLWKRPRFWLVVMVVGFFFVSLYSGIVAFDNFQTKNSTDAGIITQAVATALHGKPAPFFESYDCMDKLRCSFLLVHPAFVLYAALPFYALVPSTLTLFALRSAIVALAALPLFWLTRQATRSSGKALLAAGLFLVWAPLLAGDVFSLHVESLLPLELFSLAALWQAHRFRLGLAVAGIMFLSFEIYPVFAFLVGVFYLFPYIERIVRIRWARWRSKASPRASLRATISSWVETARAGWRNREVRFTLVLMASSLVAYVLLQTFMNVWGYEVLGVVSPAAHPGITGIFYDPSTPPQRPFLAIFSSPQTVATGEFWLILYALVAFLPLLSPRALILSVPWIGYTFLTESPRYTTIGSQYTMIAAAPMFIGLAYALVRVPLFPAPAPSPTEEAETSGRDLTARPHAHRRRSRAIRTVIVVAIAVTVVANVLFLPVDPLLPDLGVKPPRPFEPGYFDRTLTPNLAIVYAEQLAADVPPGATVLAPSPYFLLIADDAHAYVFNSAGENTSRLPFNISGGPDYVLTESSWLPKFWPALQANLSNPELYGMRGYVSFTTGGPLFLYERGRTLPATLYGPALPPTNLSYSADNGINAGPIGRLANNSTVPSGHVIESVPGLNRTGLVWSAPLAIAAPGNYTLQLQVSLTAFTGKNHSGLPVLRIFAGGFGETLANATYPPSAFVLRSWTNLSFNVTLPNPLPNIEIEGFLMAARAGVAIASVTIRPAG